MIAGHILVSIVLIFAVTTCEDPFSNTTDMTQYIAPAMHAFDCTFIGNVSADEDYIDYSSQDGGVSNIVCSYVGEPFELTLNVDPDMHCWNWEWETDSEDASPSASVNCMDAECGALTATGTFKLGSESYNVGAAFVLEKEYFNVPNAEVTYFIWINDFENSFGDADILMDMNLSKKQFDIIDLIFATYCSSASDGDCVRERCRLNIVQ